MSKTKQSLALLVVVSLGLLLLTGCATSKTARSQTAKPVVAKSMDDYPMPYYVKALKGQKICLDPGHGGDGNMGNYKRGPTGVREAEVNLRVANYLQDFLTRAGAVVYMTRTTDIFVGLNERTDYVNTCGAEYFISMHHNAISNPSTNFTSTWYHAEPDYGHMNLDMARYIQDGVANSLNLEQRPSLAIMSDYYVYPDAGFAVLRNSKLPSCLCEASFHSNPEEEQRINDPAYNKREAYGYFIGLAKFFFSGVPKVEYLKAEKMTSNRQPEFQVKIYDGFRNRLILKDSIRVKIDDKVLPFTYNQSSGIITVQPVEPLANNYHTLYTDFENINKTSVYPNPFTFQIVPEVRSLEVKVYPSTIPNDGNAQASIQVYARDQQGNPSADNTIIELSSDKGAFSFSLGSTQNGYFQTYLFSSKDTGMITITAKNNSCIGTAAVMVQKTKTAFLVAEIYDQRTKQTIENAHVTVVTMMDNPSATTNRDGKGILSGVYSGRQMVEVTAAGYLPLKQAVDVKANETVNLRFDLLRN